MASRDILVLNTTASRAETQQGSDTVAIRGDSSKILSVENSSGVSVLSVDSYSSSIELTGDITASGNISSSLSSTASIGRLEATTLIGSAFNLTGTAIENTISSSAQIAPYISGSFRRGFEFTGTIGDQPGGLDNKITASFGRIVATSFSGSAANLTNTDLDNTISGSAQIASQISGAFTSGFNYDGKISGSVTSTGSFTRIDAITLAGDGTELTNIAITDTISGSAQIASQISGAFNKGFEYDGTIQGITIGDNFVTNGTFDSDSGWTKETGWTIAGGKAVATNAGATYTIYQTSAQTITANTTYRVTYTISDFTSSPSGLRIRIGSQLLGTARSSNGTFVEDVTTGGSIGNQGIGFYSSGGSTTLKIDDVKFQKISKGADSTSTGSFDRIVATTITGDISNMTGVGRQNMISGSAQIASRISGSFNKGFTFDGDISGSATSTASFGRFVASKMVGDITGMTNIIPRGALSSSAQIASRVTGSFNHGFEFVGKISASAGTTNTGSFSHLVATTITGDVSGMTGADKPGFISSSAQIASRVSGSFGKGFNLGPGAYSDPTPGIFTSFNHRAIASTLGAFSAGGALIVAKRNTAGIGSKAGALVVGGDTNPDPAAAHLGTTEEYNGTSFSEVNDLITPRKNIMGAGTTEAGIVAGGSKFPSNGTIACTEVYNGTNWSEEADMNYCTKASGDAGDSSEAAIVFGGNFNTPVSHYTGQSEEYNGTTWSEINSLITSRSDLAGFGNSEAAIAAAGEPTPGGHMPGNSFATEEWNGTNWSTVADTLKNPFMNNYVKGAGTVNDGHAFGGCYRCYVHPGPTTYHYDAESQHWDGTSWTHGGALISGRRFGGGDGTSGGDGFYVGGGVGPAAPSTSTCMEVYSRVFTTGSFGRLETRCLRGDISNMTNINSPTIVTGSSQIAANISGSFNKGFTFEGTIQNTPYTFTETAVLNASRQSLGASGIKTAGLVFGGYAHPTQVGSTETFNGSAWSEVNDLIAAGRGIGGSGTSTAAIAYGGHPTRNQYTEEWNGTNWSEVNDLIRSDFACQAADIGHSSEAAIAAGSCTTGTFGASSVLCNEEWNGTNWASANALIHNASQTGGGAGSANAGITAGGFISPGYPGAHRCTQTWNGTNWSESEAALPPSNHRGILYGWGGSQNDAIITSGCSYQGGLFDTSYCYNGISWSAGSAIGTLTGASSAGVYRHKGAGTTVDNSFFAGGIGGGGGGNSSIAATFCTDNGVATGSFSHIDAIRITGSVDGMTNIPEPEGTISSSAQIASNISGSFNKGFEFTGEIESKGVWSAGGAFPGNLKHTYFGGVWGTQNSALLGGGIGIYQAGVCDTYSYNGTSWSDTGANMIDTKGGYTAHGTENSALAAGGIQYKSHIFQYLRINTEEWNGSAWSATTNLPHQLAFLNNQKGGTQNAALIAGGYTGTGAENMGSGSEAFQKSNLVWDGLSYTVGASMDNERGTGGFVGSVNSGLAQGGNNSLGASTCTEEWNGTAWSDTAASNFPTGFTQTVGTTNNAMHTTDFGNSPNKTACTDFYNGVSWSTGPNAPSGDTLELKCAGSAGSTSAGLFMAYGNSCVQHFDAFNTTASLGTVETPNLSIDKGMEVKESFQLPVFAANPPVTSSAGEVWYNRDEQKLYFTYDINTWSEVTDMNTDKSNSGAAACSHGDAIIAGGRSAATPNLAITEVWDGNTWSEVNDLNQARRHLVGAGYGSTSALVTGGFEVAIQNDTEEWNGTNWTEVANNTYAYAEMQMSGTSNAAMSNGGVTNSPYAEQTGTAEWNGTSWTAAAARSVAVAAHGGAGSQNSAITFGGEEPGTNELTCTEEYNGTNWATGVPLLIAANSNQGSGTQNAAMSTSTQTSPYNQTQEYNGSAWSQTANLTAGLKDRDGGGSQSSTIVMGGNYGVGASKTETYTTTGIGCHCIGGV